MAIDYDALRNDPHVQSFLNIIAKSEGTEGRGNNGYNIIFGGKKFSNYADHPRISKQFRETTGARNVTTAAGRYGILAPTWDDVKQRIGATTFSPENQDKAAIELIRQHGALDDVLSGNYADAINKLGNVWASFPSSPYAQPKNTMGELLGTSVVPTQVVNKDGQQMMAFPENADEHQFMMNLHDSGHPETMQSAILSGVDMLNNAFSALGNQKPLFSNYPTELDSKLLELIDKA